MIKIYTLATILSLLTVSAKSQFDKGQKVLGGNINFSTSKNQNIEIATSQSKGSNFYINPSMGSFVKPNVLCGIGFGYSYNYSENNANNGTSGSSSVSNGININAFSQRFFTLTPNLFFTITTGATAGYNFGSATSTSSNVGSKLNNNGYNVSVALAPGLSYKLTSRLLFDAYLSNLINAGYYHSVAKAKNAPTDSKLIQSGLNLSSSLSNTSLGNVGLGFRWLLKKK